ncbi:MAG: hypothetical protein BGO78_09230 [Chloroflexi bacterium 44-23]|nr:MAG: hypothetical protein BGO78_09230 [Chloroflexi bacterium 44-23]
MIGYNDYATNWTLSANNKLGVPLQAAQKDMRANGSDFQTVVLILQGHFSPLKISSIPFPTGFTCWLFLPVQRSNLSRTKQDCFIVGNTLSGCS